MSQAQIEELEKLLKKGTFKTEKAKLEAQEHKARNHRLIN